MATPLLSLDKAHLAYGDRVLLNGVDLRLAPRARIALVGRNGAGKSTLLQVLAGRLKLDGGDRVAAPRARSAYLEQTPTFDEAVAARDWLGRADAEAPDGLPAHIVEATLTEVDLGGDSPARLLSGGQQRRLALARALALNPDVLLLDEPTNHLDIDTILWLQDRVIAFPGAVVAISHDRAFLDAVADRCWWLDRGRLVDLQVPFRELEEAITAELERQAQAAAKLDQRIAAETRWSREGLTARRKRNQGRLRRLEAMRKERAQRRPLPGVTRLEATAAPGAGTLVVEAEDISKSFGGQLVVPTFSTRILKGDRVGIVGRNGAGKSTLLGLLTGQLAPDEGMVRRGTGLEVAWYEQDRSSIDPAATPWEVLCPEGGDRVPLPTGPRHVVGYLKDFLFDEAQIRTPCRALSGGERNRLLLARILARPSNLLVLDEPTNDLDIETLDVLTGMLADYAGTLLVVSHDRDFLDRTVTSTLAFEPDGRLVDYAGGYSDMLAQRQATASEQAARPSAKPVGKRNFTTPGKEQRRREREALKAEREVERLHAEIARIEELLADGSLFVREPDRATGLAKALDELQRREVCAAQHWLELAEALDRD